MQITRSTNPNGTYRYEVDGDVQIKASKVLYTHASTYTVAGENTVLFHKSEVAALKATGYASSGWVKTEVVEITNETV